MDTDTNGDLNNIAEDVDDLQEDIDSVDKKLWILIALWIIDKIVMAMLIILLGK